LIILTYYSEKTHPKCNDGLNDPRADTTIDVCRVPGERAAVWMYGEVNTVVSRWEACLNQGRTADINEENEGEQRGEEKASQGMQLTPRTVYTLEENMDARTWSPKAAMSLSHERIKGYQIRVSMYVWMNQAYCSRETDA